MMQMSRRWGTNRRIGLLIVVGLLLIVGGVVGLQRSNRPDRSAVRAATRNPSFSLPDLRDPAASPISPERFRGTPIVMNFFFSTCPPCAAELPRLEHEHRAHPEVAFVGIDHFEPRADGLRIVARSGITYPIGWDETGRVAPTVGAVAFPTTIFIDRSGIVRKRVLGAITNAELRRNIAAISRVPS